MNREIGQRYATAYATHYVEKDLQQALVLYSAIIDAAPDTAEAMYCRAQLQNIANTVVPRPELLAAVVELARVHLQRAAPLGEPAAPPTE